MKEDNRSGFHSPRQLLNSRAGDSSRNYAVQLVRAQQRGKAAAEVDQVRANDKLANPRFAP